MQICHKYRKHHLQYMIIEFNNILQMRMRLRSNPNVASAEGVPKEPTEAKRKRLRRIQMKRS